MSRLSDAALRQQGRAEAAAILTLKRVNAGTMTAEDWGRLLDVTPAEMRDAVRRLADTPENRARRRAAEKARRAAAKPKTGPKTGSKLDMPTVSCPEPGCGWTGKRLWQHSQSHLPPVPCPDCDRKIPPISMGRHRAAFHPKAARA